MTKVSIVLVINVGFFCHYERSLRSEESKEYASPPLADQHDKNLNNSDY